MIVVDTNVLSEPLRPDPDPGVLAWLAAHTGDLAITTISISELRYGIRRLPSGRRRRNLDSAVSALIEQAGSRVLGFGLAAAEHYAAIRATREQKGVVIGLPDTMIAAICQTSECAVATRNVDDFREAGLTIINPFGD